MTAAELARVFGGTEYAVWGSQVALHLGTNLDAARSG